MSDRFAAPEGAIHVGVSSCLLGHEVRYDGGHKQDRYILDTLADHFTLVPVCPEQEVGMGTPRETIRLVGDSARPRLLGSKSGTDWTRRMEKWSRRRARELATENLSGYIFKKDSPSCGVFRVKVYSEQGQPRRDGRGLFAAEFARRFPLTPIEEEGRLHDAVLRDNFITRVFARHRLQQLFGRRWQRRDVIAFHAREKYLLMAHDAQGLKRLGQLVAAISQHTPAAFRDLYSEGFMKTLTRTATPRRQVNAMQHIAGYLRAHLDTDVQHRVLAMIEDYRAGLVPLIVPLTILKHYIELHDVAYVRDQTYLNPHPRELMLRNHV